MTCGPGCPAVDSALEGLYQRLAAKAKAKADQPPPKRVVARSKRKPYRRRPKLICLRGHDRTPENVNSGGRCKICRREDAKRYYGGNGTRLHDKVQHRPTPRRTTT